MSQPSRASSFFDQPKAVWATAFACVVGFMSIGLVDPILTSIAKGLNASASQVSLLFSSYFFVTSVMMLITGFVSSRLGGRKTLLLGAVLIVVFSALAGSSNSITALVGFRAGWGLGNAFFVVTALSVIVAASRGGTAAAILMYELALGLGISAGPLVGAALGGMSWRYPFFGTATLMTIGFVAIALWLPEQPKPAQKISLSAPIRALGHGGLLTAAVSAFFYNYAFFTVLAFVPFVLKMSAHSVGLIFFGWGVLLAIFSVVVAPRLQARFGTILVLFGCLFLFAVLLLVMAFTPVLVVSICVVLSGALMGVCNTVYTEMALEVSDVPRPVASAGYNFVRWFAGVVAPYAAPLIAETINPELTFIVAAAAAVTAPTILAARRSSLGRFGGASAAVPEAPVAAGVADRWIIAAIDGSASDRNVLERAADLAREAACGVEVLHVRAFEVFDEDAVADEGAEAAKALVERAVAFLSSQTVAARGEVIESAAAHIAQTVLRRIDAVKPRFIVLGRAAGRTAIHLLHGSLSEALNRSAAPETELVIVPAAASAASDAAE